MASATGAERGSPPPSPPLPLRVRRRLSLVPLLPAKTNYPRRPGKEPEEQEEPEPSDLGSRRKRRCVLVQDDQVLSRVDNHDLQLEAKELLQSHCGSRMLTLLRDFAEFLQSSDQSPQSQIKALWNYCACKFPNAFSLQLTQLLNSHIPDSLRIHTVALLHRTLIEIHGKDMSRIDDRVLISLKPLLLQVLENDESIPNIHNLCEIVANVACRIFAHPTWSWNELLEYVLLSLHKNFELRQEMALKVFLGLPENCPECPNLYNYWESHYVGLHMRFVQLFDSPNLNIQAMTFDASVRLVAILYDLGKYEEIDDLIPRMTRFLQKFHNDGQTDFVLPRVKALAVMTKQYSEFFVRRLDMLFPCVLQIAGTADASTILRCEAVQLVQGLDDMEETTDFIINLSREDIRSVLTISVYMMMCITDNPAWYDVDIEWGPYTGTTESYRLGMYLLNRVCFNVHEAIVLSLGIEMIPTYLVAEDWQTRHAGMIIFAAIGEGCCTEIIRYSDHAQRLLDISLNDPHPRVRWAAIDAIRCISADIVDGKPVMHNQYITNFLPQLVAIISDSHFPRLQAHAARVIPSVVKNCGDDEIIPFLEDIVRELLKLLQQDKQKLKEEAMDTLKSVALSFPVHFRRYYDVTMDSLKALLFHTSCQTKLLLRAKYIECMSIIIVLGYELDGSHSRDADQAIKALLSLGRHYKKEEFSIKILILEALSQFCKLPEQIIGNFINSFMPILIRSLESDPYNCNPNNYFTTNKEKVLGCNILSYCAGRFRAGLSPWIPKVAHLFTRQLSCFDSETQMASIRALPNLLLSSQDRQESRRFMVEFIVRALVEALHEEVDTKVGTAMLESLNCCIQISGPVFNTDLIRMIADEINQILSQVPLANLAVDIGEEAESPDEGDAQDQEEEIIQGANCLITMIKTLNPTFLPYLDELLPTVALMWGDDFPNRVKAVAISIFNLLVLEHPLNLPKYHETYSSVLLDACQSESPEVQQEAARGIGYCAMFRGTVFKLDANAAINSLCSVIKHGNELDRAKTYDVAVSSIGKICGFCRHNISGPKVVPFWLNLLPLKSDCAETRYAHEQFCRMVERLDDDLLGPNNENLPKVLEVLREILLHNDRIAAEETVCKVIHLLNQYGQMT